MELAGAGAGGGTLDVGDDFRRRGEDVSRGGGGEFYFDFGVGKKVRELGGLGGGRGEGTFLFEGAVGAGVGGGGDGGGVWGGHLIIWRGWCCVEAR